MAASRLEFRILGPLVVRVDGAVVPVGGPKQRALLALLLLSANRVVSRDRLIGELFAERSVVSADHALRNTVSRLRKVLAPSAEDEPRLVARAPGYLLRVELGELDLAVVEERIDADLALGRQLALVPELEALAAEHPFRERFRAQLMLALYRSGRQAEGLEVFRRTRALLHGEL